jgi:serine/threonine protein kinase
VDRRYEWFCLGDRLFYESPTLWRGAETDFAAARRGLPAEWESSQSGDWLVLRVRDASLPSQGWKIHASGTLDEAASVIDAVWAYCVARNITFKFVRSRRLLFIRNSKSADRWSSGKLATIYPADEAALEQILAELGTILANKRGPYILTDLRIGQGPLYVRYGGFVLQHGVDAKGKTFAAIEDAEGRLVPDRRDALFAVPDWVKLPPCLEPHMSARSSATLDQIPYEITKALHFSNGGGVYLGVDRRSGEKIVLKEGRPFAGLSADGADAVARLSRERDALMRLDGLGITPDVRDFFVLEGHHFLVEDFIEGKTLNALFADEYPLIRSAPSQETLAQYASWVVDTCGRVERAVEAIHQRGICIRDLHPRNIIIRPDGEIALVDLEAATDADSETGSSLGAPGFAAPPDRRGFSIDNYALASLRLFLFLPLTSLIPLNPEKALDLGNAIPQLFPVETHFISDAVATIVRHQGPPPARGASTVRATDLRSLPETWFEARDSMVRAIMSTATPDREDRLFPGDVEQSGPCGGLNLAFGAAGVLYALNEVGADRNEEHEEWMLKRVKKTSGDVPLGFYNGLHGVAYALDRLGRRGDALDVLDRCVNRANAGWQSYQSDLFGGLAGIALTLLYFAQVTRDASFLRLAIEAAGIVAGRLRNDDANSAISGGDHPYAGLMRGLSGTALLFLRLYEETGDTCWLDRAGLALRQDLRRCVRSSDGALHVNEGWRLMPYLADGSAGVGFVLDQYLTYRSDESFAEALAAIQRAAEAPFYIHSGLFQGRAGMILFLARASRRVGSETSSTVAEQTRRLAWHALDYRGNLAFPGDQIRRLSMDFASGTAGVMFAMGFALGAHNMSLPFLGPGLQSFSPVPLDSRAQSAAPGLVAKHAKA